MPTQVLSAFILFAVVVLIMNLIMRSRGRHYKKEFNDYLEAEQKANFAPKQAIDEALFFHPDLNKYPLWNIDSENEPLLAKAQETVIHKASLKMLHFDPPRTNLELKMAFGLANLENITLFEEHYNQFMRALVDWAEALKTAGNDGHMEQVLLAAIQDGCDLSKAYTMLADFYDDKRDKKALNDLHDSLQARQLPAHQTVSSYIHHKLAGL